ncbi:MAG: signal peptidase, partial [Candidatus Schekmanbacteria bacterium RBG_16_38_10]
MHKDQRNSEMLSYGMFFCLILFLISTLSCIFISAKIDPFLRGKEPLKEVFISGKGNDKILMIDISGIISEAGGSGVSGLFSNEDMVASIKEQLEKAKEDNRIKAVILRINSPGGTVTASDIIYNEIKKFKEENDIKIISCMMDVGASGAYYIAMASDVVIAHPTALTGSIGVIFENFNVEGLFNKLGIKDASIKSGDKKDIGSPFRAITEEEKEILQEVNDNLYQRFFDVVYEGREELDRDDVKRLADGRIYSAEQALEEKLIDKIGYLDDAIEVA